MSLRNIAIIAHVDHGKTTLVDKLLQQSGLFRDNEKLTDRAMDSNDLERERGITILAKVTSVEWKDHRINIVDTPGHADFGGEVERILGMVDGAIVLVDAAEGPMPQTKFVVGKALKAGLKPIVAVNKIDKPEERHAEVIDEVFDLFANLDATDEQLDFPILYGSAKQGWMATEPDGPQDDMSALFDLVLSHVPEPTVEDGPFRMIATTVAADPYLGRILTGRIASGTARPNMPFQALSREGDRIETGRLSKVLAFRGLERTPLESAEAGDIISIAGMVKATVADTLCDPSVTEALPAQPIDPPTLSMTFRVNDSPLAGREGDKVQSRVIRARLMKEAEGNVALRVTDAPDADAFEVAGRGELQLSILIETMRREGFELGVSRPRVLMQRNEAGQLEEPLEEVTIDVDDEFSGAVVQKLAERKADLIEMRPSGGGRTRLVFHAPTRGLIGYQGELMSDTRGTAIFNRVFHDYVLHKGEIKRPPHRRADFQRRRRCGRLCAVEPRRPRPDADRSGRQAVYRGMIIGEHTRGNDLEVNVLKGKQLTNIRAAPEVAYACSCVAYG
jgi:GTP-binding protein